MNVKDRERQARTPLQEGLSIAPYMLVFQRLHRRRWAGALVAAAAGLAWWWGRRR